MVLEADVTDTVRSGLLIEISLYCFESSSRVASAGRENRDLTVPGRSWVSDCTSFDPHDRFTYEPDSTSGSGLFSCRRRFGTHRQEFANAVA